MLLGSSLKLWWEERRVRVNETALSCIAFSPFCKVFIVSVLYKIMCSVMWLDGAYAEQ